MLPKETLQPRARVGRIRSEKCREVPLGSRQYAPAIARRTGCQVKFSNSGNLLAPRLNHTKGKARTNLQRKPSIQKKTPKPPKTFGANGVFYTFPQGEGGPLEIKFDFAQVPAPLNYYYCDALHISLDADQQMLVLSFGRRDDSPNFADRIDMIMPKKSLTGAFWASTRDVEAAVDKMLETAGISHRPREANRSSQSGPTPTFFANILLLTAGDGESSLDFYHLSPREIHLAKAQKKEMNLLPVARVIMSTPLTKELFTMLRPFAQSDPTLVPAAEGGKRVARS